MARIISGKPDWLPAESMSVLGLQLEDPFEIQIATVVPKASWGAWVDNGTLGWFVTREKAQAVKEAIEALAAQLKAAAEKSTEAPATVTETAQ